MQFRRLVCPCAVESAILRVCALLRLPSLMDRNLGLEIMLPPQTKTGSFGLRCAGELKMQ